MELMQTLRRMALVDDEWDDKARRFQLVRERLGDVATLQGKQAEQRARQDRLTTLRRELADLELELASLQSRSRQAQEALYSGDIVAPRELENLRRESESLHRRIGQLTDQTLERMTEAEELTIVVEQGAAELSAFERAWHDLTASARDEYAVLRTRLQELKAERDGLRTRVPRRELALYDELRRSKGGRPLAPMAGRVCQICRVSVPAHKANIAEDGLDALATCEGCGRILYLP